MIADAKVLCLCCRIFFWCFECWYSCFVISTQSSSPKFSSLIELQAPKWPTWLIKKYLLDMNVPVNCSSSLNFIILFLSNGYMSKTIFGKFLQINIWYFSILPQSELISSSSMASGVIHTKRSKKATSSPKSGIKKFEQLYIVGGMFNTAAQYFL